MRVLYLYAEVMGYTMATVSQLVKKYGCDVHIVQWDTGKLTPYEAQKVDHVSFYNRSEYTSSSLLKLAVLIDPDIIVVSGWMDKGYLPVAKYFRERGLPVVAGLDRQWDGSIRQTFGACIKYFVRNYFTHAWVCGVYQYEFARRFGFAKDEIIFNLYSADLNLFNKAFEIGCDIKRVAYPHRFLYVGRLEEVKGIASLIEAWIALGDGRKNWDLRVIGNGSKKHSFENIKGISVSNFLQPEELVDEICRAGCLVLPSLSEPWGVVLHEFAAAGMPIVCTSVCGASSAFVINGFNGFLVNPGRPQELANSMLKIVGSNDDSLRSMANNSHRLGQNITPELSAASLISTLRDMEHLSVVSRGSND